MNGDSLEVIKTVDDNENKLGRNLLLRIVFSSFLCGKRILIYIRFDCSVSGASQTQILITVHHGVEILSLCQFQFHTHVHLVTHPFVLFCWFGFFQKRNGVGGSLFNLLGSLLLYQSLTQSTVMKKFAAESNFKSFSTHWSWLTEKGSSFERLIDSMEHERIRFGISEGEVWNQRLT